jgi:low temperature requirement protein LtrA
MTASSILSPEDQGATFVELFFDLVFVFAITQVTHYAAHHLDVRGILRAALVFWKPPLTLMSRRQNAKVVRCC